MTTSTHPLHVQMLMVHTVRGVSEIALEILVSECSPRWACVLVWDAEMARHIIGGVWVEKGLDAAAIRRRALSLLTQPTDDTLTSDERDVAFYLLSAHGSPCGAFCVSPPVDVSQELIDVTGIALYTATRLQTADQEHATLVAEQKQLQQLLSTVAEQRQTISRLLSAERRLSNSLEEMVEERTAELQTAHASLIQSEKMAVIGKLANSLAHELNNPLQAVQSGIGLVIDEISRANFAVAQEDLLVIQDEIERIGSIFRQMLDFNRPAGPVYAALDLNAVCQSTQVLMRKRLQDTGMTLSLDLSEALPTTCGDINQIKQILINLLLNAQEACQPDGGQMTIRTGHNDETVWLSVTDDGPGIEPHHLNKLFEPLYTTKTRGLGLGLSICKEIIERHDGRIDVESEPHRATIFIINLPIREMCDV